MEMITGMGEIIAALMTGDSFELQSALRGNSGMWPLGFIVTFVGGTAPYQSSNATSNQP